jgi:hypothetical protein
MPVGEMTMQLLFIMRNNIASVQHTSVKLMNEWPTRITKGHFQRVSVNKLENLPLTHKVFNP